MNPEAQAILDRILKKEIHELTEFDKGFLRARRDYLGRNSRHKFASVLDEKNPEPKQEEPQEEGKTEEEQNRFPGEDDDDVEEV